MVQWQWRAVVTNGNWWGPWSGDGLQNSDANEYGSLTSGWNVSDALGSKRQRIGGYSIGKWKITNDVCEPQPYCRKKHSAPLSVVDKEEENNVSHFRSKLQTTYRPRSIENSKKWFSMFTEKTLLHSYHYRMFLTHPCQHLCLHMNHFLHHSLALLIATCFAVINQTKSLCLATKTNWWYLK